MKEIDLTLVSKQKSISRFYNIIHPPLGRIDFPVSLYFLLRLRFKYFVRKISGFFSKMLLLRQSDKMVREQLYFFQRKLLLHEIRSHIPLIPRTTHKQLYRVQLTMDNTLVTLLHTFSTFNTF